MRTQKLFFRLLFSVLFLIPAIPICSQPADNAVKVTGAMKNVMWKGQLYGTIDLDTIADKKSLYGLGPLEYLKGELLVVEGKSYVSKVLTDTTMKVTESFQVRAPFFVYSNVENWREYILPDSIENVSQLENYLDQVTINLKRPFAFKLTGVVDSATIHIVNLPDGSKVSSPEEAHREQKSYYLKNEPSIIVGFFSTMHKAVFTHHDTFIHMHLITANKSKMGHLDEVTFSTGKMKLFLPEGM